MKKTIFLSVTNDLTTDQRVHKIAQSLSKSGANIILIGRKLPRSLPVSSAQYSIKRFSLIFNKGLLFYAEYNIRLLLYILFKKADILVANDLDTLPANYLCSKLKRAVLVYDSHEYFTEVPELIHRKNIQKIWEAIERFILPKLKFAYTVSHAIAMEYEKKYNIHMETIRNVPIQKELKKGNAIHVCDKNKKIILYQGVLNKGRGIETIIRAMKYLDDFCFVIIGDGVIGEKLKMLTDEEGVSDKVVFVGKVPYQELYFYTICADLGIVLEENTGLNYYYSLSNKLFDYIHANVPVLSNDFPENMAIIQKYGIGFFVENRDPAWIANAVKQKLSNAETVKQWKKNLTIAAKELCWEREEYKLIAIYEEAGLVLTDGSLPLVNRWQDNK